MPNSMSSKRTGTVCGLLAAAACAVTPMLASGCAEEPTMLVISGVVPVEAEAGACVVTPDSDFIVVAGTLDVAAANGYALAPRVENVAPSSEEVGTTRAGGAGGGTQTGGGFENLDLEGNAIFVTKAAVDFDVKADLPGVDLAGFDVPIGGPMVTPGGGSAAFLMPVLTEFQVSQLRTVIAPGQSALIVVKVKVFGQTASETDVETNTLGFPITVCNGCLGIPQCTSEQAAGLEEEGCLRPGQDQQYCLSVAADPTP